MEKTTSEIGEREAAWHQYSRAETLEEHFAALEKPLFSGTAAGLVRRLAPTSGEGCSPEVSMTRSFIAETAGLVTASRFFHYYAAEEYHRQAVLRRVLQAYRRDHTFLAHPGNEYVRQFQVDAVIARMTDSLPSMPTRQLRMVMKDLSPGLSFSIDEKLPSRPIRLQDWRGIETVRDAAITRLAELQRDGRLVLGGSIRDKDDIIERCTRAALELAGDAVTLELGAATREARARLEATDRWVQWFGLGGLRAGA